MKKKPKQKNILIMNKDLELALTGFRPQFANTQDIAILNRVSSLKQMLETVDNNVLRSGKSRDKELTGKMKEILDIEKRLIAEITSRNMDF